MLRRIISFAAPSLGAVDANLLALIFVPLVIIAGFATDRGVAPARSSARQQISVAPQNEPLALRPSI